MEPIKQKDYLPASSPSEGDHDKCTNLPLELLQRVELDIILEELAEIIESENGILTP
jgi:hypothetical protein